MFIAYQADFDLPAAGWKHDKSPDLYIGLDQTTVGQLAGWVEPRIVDALKEHRRVWVYWPYWANNHGEWIKERAEEIHTRLVDQCLCDEQLAQGFRVLTRHLGRPVSHWIEKVDKAHCVVYYVEPSTHLSK